MKVTLTDRKLKSLKPTGQPFFVWDVAVPGFGVRVMGKPKAPVLSFGVMKRLSGREYPTFSVVGHYGAITLEDARIKARGWLAEIAAGRDPRKLEKARLEAEHARQTCTFDTALAAYLEHKSGLRTIGEIKREMRREFGHWLSWPITDIDEDHIKRTIKRIIPRGREQARASFRRLASFFTWVVDTGDYGIKVSPLGGLKVSALVGDATNGSRQRVLTDSEISAYWRASSTLRYPLDQYFKLLLLTALRRNECSDAVWREFDLKNKLWVIPAARMKGREGKAVPHAVPLTDDILALLEGLPRFTGDCLFSSTGGRRPINGFTTAKARLDKAMRADLGERFEPFTPFTIHDVRRTVRTRLSGLKVQTEVAEAILAHAKPGIQGVYNLHDYLDEKRAALAQWHGALRQILEPPWENVIVLTARA